MRMRGAERAPRFSTGFGYTNRPVTQIIIWLFRLLYDKRSVKTHIRTVVRIFRIWTGVPDVVHLAGNFALQTEKIFAL